MSTLRIIIGIAAAAVLTITVLGLVLYAPFSSSTVEPVEVKKGTVSEGAGKGDEKEGAIDTKKAANDIKVTLRVPSSSAKSGDRVPLELSFENKAAEARELQFSSSQKYDFWVEDEKGNEIWRWSQDQMFAQMLESVSVEPGEIVTYAEEWPLTNFEEEPVAPGSYTLNAIVAANELRDEVLTIRVDVKQ